MYKAHQVQSTFGSCDVEKVDVVVARSTFQSQNAQGTSALDHFWKLPCQKGERKFVARSTCRSQKCRKTEGFGRRKGFCTLTKVIETWTFVAVSTTTTIKLHYATLPYATLRYTTLHYPTLHFFPQPQLQLRLQLDYVALHYTTLHYTTLHYNMLHSIALHSTSLHPTLPTATTLR